MYDCDSRRDQRSFISKIVCIHNSKDLLLKRLATIIFVIRILRKVEHISKVAAITIQTYGGSQGHRLKESKTKK